MLEENTFVFRTKAKQLVIYWNKTVLVKEFIGIVL